MSEPDGAGSAAPAGRAAGGATTLVSGIGLLVTNDPTVGDGSALGVIHDAALVLHGEHLAWVGPSAQAPDADHRVDVAGRTVIPGLVDSHAHLVFAGDRAEEFAARMAGKPYSAGGIASTVAATRAATDAALCDRAASLMHEMRSAGTTTIEVKSGYGLTVEDEARSLRVARQLTPETTFLGAHVVPPEYAGRREDYIRLVCNEMTQACAPHARWVDVFCDRGAFDADEARAVLEAGMAHGLIPRLHGNQLEQGPGVQLAVSMAAASVDHCTHTDDADVEALAGASATTVATLLPGAEFSTRSPYPNGRRLLDAGATVALATDCNPGSSYTSSLPFCIALAVREMSMTAAEALWAATAGGARALRRDDIGVLRPCARADFAVLDAPSYVHLAYRPGVALVTSTWLGGEPSPRSGEPST
jgi:imidazolonepropionase